jgi:signal transduction histidine kinase
VHGGAGWRQAERGRLFTADLAFLNRYAADGTGVFVGTWAAPGVHPAILVEAGLGAAIRALARRSPLPVRVRLRAGGRLPGSCEITAYYVAAEAFTNAAKHANASVVDIRVEQADDTLTVEVRDDGDGGADASRGSGLTGLRDRVEAVGGSMRVDSPAGAGTVVTVLLPVTADDH